MSRQSFDFGTQAQVGMEGMKRIVAFLSSRGLEVVDVEKDKHWRRRDVDLIVNGRTMEVKTDLHTTGNLYLELTCDGKPGCVFKSRAEVWAYWFPVLDILLFIRLPELQHWLMEHASEYARSNIRSHRKQSSWKAHGIAVPIVHLLDADIAVKVGSLADTSNEAVSL